MLEEPGAEAALAGGMVAEGWDRGRTREKQQEGELADSDLGKVVVALTVEGTDWGNAEVEVPGVPTAAALAVAGRTG
jgi:hypothetical protein